VLTEVLLMVIHGWFADTVNVTDAPVGELMLTLCSVAVPPAAAEKDNEAGFAEMLDRSWCLACAGDPNATMKVTRIAK
jgi:hypothetical protein